MDKIKAVCLDIDGVLVPGNSWLKLTEGLGCSVEEHKEIFGRALRGELTFKQTDEILMNRYRSSGKATRNFIEKIYEKSQLDPVAAGIMKYLKSKYTVFLASGSNDIFVSMVASKLKIARFYANSNLEFDELGMLSAFNYRGNQAEVKLEQLKELAGSLGITEQEIACVGDSYNDMDIFRVTGHGVCLGRETSELSAVAWKIIDRLGELRQVL